MVGAVYSLCGQWTSGRMFSDQLAQNSVNGSNRITTELSQLLAGCRSAPELYA